MCNSAGALSPAAVAARKAEVRRVKQGSEESLNGKEAEGEQMAAGCLKEDVAGVTLGNGDGGSEGRARGSG